MADKVIAILEKSREEVVERCNRELAEIDQAISRLRASDGKAQSSKTIQIRRGQFSGMSITPALQQYLNERGGGPVGIKQVTHDMRLAGVEPKWSTDRFDRNIKIAISNNAKIFSYDEQAQTVALIRSSSKLA